MSTLHPVVESLLEVVEEDPYPKGHTSPYWQREGEGTTVLRKGGTLVLRGFGIGTGGPRGLAWEMGHALERFSYRSVTARLRSYPLTWKLTRDLARDLSLGKTYDLWRYGVILAVLADHWKSYRLSPRTFAMIGDGNGFLGALIHRFLPTARIYCIDLPKALVFQATTHSRVDGGVFLARVTSHGEVSRAQVLFALPQEAESIREVIDCAVNVASMQEMNAGSVESYFSFLRQRSKPSSRFYCVNREEKELPGGEVIRFADYPWAKEDQVFLDGPCPYYTHYLSRCLRPLGPRILGFRVPFVNTFDGPMVHRLVHLARLS